MAAHEGSSSSDSSTPRDPFHGEGLLHGADVWAPPPSTAERLEAGRALRRDHPRSALAQLGQGERRPLEILDEQNSTRIPELLPLRRERMSQSAFSFFRGAAAIMAADLADEPRTGITIPSCGDAHIANFGFYASTQRTLVFDLNDFDEAAWAPWEWDVKRLTASVAIAGQEASRDASVIGDAVRNAVTAYANALHAAVQLSPSDRYYAHIEADSGEGRLPASARKVLRSAIDRAQKHTEAQAVAKLTTADADGRLRFVEAPPTMVRPDSANAKDTERVLSGYADEAATDIRQLLRHYVPSDVIRRVVGVGSVGTRCMLTLLQDGDGNALILQSKQAEQSVLERYGKIAQPQVMQDLIGEQGQGARAISLQRVLQAVSDPFLGCVRDGGIDLYVRQFHDMKGGIDALTLEDEPFDVYAQACGVALARAHAQSTLAAVISGYVGRGKQLGEALLEWALAYAERNAEDHRAFVAAGEKATATA